MSNSKKTKTTMAEATFKNFKEFLKAYFPEELEDENKEVNASIISSKMISRTFKSIKL